MKSFAERALEEARLVMLQALKSQASGSLPVSLFRDALEVEGHIYSNDRIRTELRALQELGVLKLIAYGETPFSIAELTERGADFLSRRIIVDGIKRPEFRGA
ncbi:hypothetical protein [Methylopila sp. M107]|uniref:VpaChn25_0724 family phage protein n=1 Tax=Methylopila sp. M107 TaxID=1101190 RepID=UPI000373DFE9|nr:hypothetical protein [Methylopila sp. M107]